MRQGFGQKSLCCLLILEDCRLYLVKSHFLADRLQSLDVLEVMEGSSGYANLSSVMATDRELAIYRRFGALNSQNLLYYQAELLGLEDDLREISAEDRRSQDPDKRLYGDNWYELSNAEPGKDMQLQKVLQIRKLLKEYSVIP